VRYKKIFSAVALVTIISLLGIALAALPALAAESITLDPEEGEIGDSIRVRGSGFTHSTDTTTYYVYIYLTSEEIDVDDDDSDDIDNYERWTDSLGTDGEFSKNITIPEVLDEGAEDEDVHGGTYYIYVTYSDKDDIEDYEELTIIAAEIVADPDEGTVGTEVEISGQYFTASDDITVEFGGDDITDDIVDGDTDTDSNGEFDCTIEVPESTAGDHTIAVEDEHDHIAEATFTVESYVALVPAEGSINEQVAVSGTGFGGRKDVTVSFGGTEVATADTNNDGSFTATFNVPQVDAGTYTVEAEDEDGNSATADFNMSSSINLGTQTTSASPGYVGMQMTLTGTGFLPNHPVTITYATTPITVATATTDANGDFTATFTIPASTPGAHTITATDGTNTLTETFYMESSPPSTPQPLLPLMDSKAKQPVLFDWEDVTDPSGVTYTLQIATDENFATVVLEKTDIAASEYTLTAEEKLPSRSLEEPYYWRVKAIDGAYNESGWTGAGTFAVGGLFDFSSRPGWLIHLWWGLGAMGAGLGGYFMGKRRAYYY